MSRRIDYKIQGLDCSEEVAILRREVGGKPGVIDLLEGNPWKHPALILVKTCTAFGKVWSPGCRPRPGDSRAATAQGCTIPSPGNGDG